MISPLETSRPSIVSPATDGGYGTPPRRGRLLAKAIAALNAPSLGSSVRPLANSQYFPEMVATRAYFKAQQRGFESGHELEDWLEAERELLGVPAYFLD